MKHYSESEWLSFAGSLIDEEIKNEMEEHLCICNKCMECYIEILEKKDEAGVENYISPDFTERVMKQVAGLEVKASKQAGLPRRIFLYYTAAACITLFLMGSGAFNLLLKTVPSTTAAIINSPVKIESSLEKIKYNNNKIMQLLKIKI